MDEMIKKDLIRTLRGERSWSQDQLASISGLSLRTIQRIEKQGTCSLDSKKALASAFDLDVVNLEQNAPKTKTINSAKRGLVFGFTGVLIGLLCAYAGITTSLLSNHITLSEAGLYYGVGGAFSGIACSIIILLSKPYEIIST